MKKIFLILSTVFSSYFLHGQCDVGYATLQNQSEIDQFVIDYSNCTELTGMVTIEGEGYDISNFNNFKKIEDLVLDGSAIIDLKGLEKLEVVRFLRITNNAKLKSLGALNNLKRVETLLIFNNGALDDIKMEALIDVMNGVFISSNSSLTSIEGFRNLKTLGYITIVSNSNLKKIDCFKNLRLIENGCEIVENNALETLKLDMDMVRGPLIITDNDKLSSFDFPILTTLESLELQNYIVESMMGFSNLVTSLQLIIFDSNFKNLIGLEKLQTVDNMYIHENLQLESLEGLNKYVDLTADVEISNNPKLVDCEILCFLAQSADFWVFEGNGKPCNNINPDECKNVVKGHVFYDINENGKFDPDEILMENFKVSIQPENTLKLTDEHGQFSVFLFSDDENQMVSLEGYNEFTLTSDPESYEISYSDLDNIGPLDFGLIHDGDYHDIISNISSFAPRCNEEVEFQLKLTNIGSFVENGQVIIRYDATTEFTGEANPSPSSIDTAKHLLYYDYQDFNPFEIRKYFFTLKMPGVEAIEEFISNSGLIYNIENGDTLFLEHCNLREQIQCSYDPNDKTAYPFGVQDEHYTLKADTLRYRVRFQNTGNAEAYNITVTDTLSEYLDLSTFKILSSSHQVQTSISRNSSREIAFLFEDIHLPDSTSNPKGSQGYVTYEILPKKGIPENTVIENTAFIYFDYNPAIVTNTTFNTMVTVIPEEELDPDPDPDTPNSLEKIKISPNLTKGIFEIDLKTDRLISIVVSDIMGQEMMRLVYEEGTSYSIQTLGAGMYFISIVDVEKESVIAIEKIMLIH